MKHDHIIKDLQVSVEAMEYSWECVLEALYGDTNSDIGLAEVVQDILALKDAELMLDLASSDAYKELYNKYKEVYGV